MARKISDAWDASSAGTVESSDSDTRMARLYSVEADSVFPQESIFFVMVVANFGIKTSSRGLDIIFGDFTMNLTGIRDPGSQRD